MFNTKQSTILKASRKDYQLEQGSSFENKLRGTGASLIEGTHSSGTFLKVFTASNLMYIFSPSVTAVFDFCLPLEFADASV